MATGSRTLKLSILGDVSDLNKSLKTANTDVETFGSKVTDFGKKAGLAFAVAGAAAVAYAGKLAIEGVKAAIEDEAAQAKLAKTLENVTGATNETIKSTEDYILKTSLAFGVTDEQLRPSLERLVRATKDVDAAQKLQALALDISAGSGKSLEAVSNALGKAYEGNTAALGKLGIGLGSAELKAMDLDSITKTLSDTFGGQATEKANTFQGKMERVKVALDEAKESVGAALLPELLRLVNFITESIVPKLNAFVGGLTGNKGMKASLDETSLSSYDLGAAFRDMAVNVSKLFGVFNDDQNTGNSSGLAKVIGWAENVINVFNKLIQAIAYTMGLIKVLTNPKNWLLGADDTVALANEYAGIATKAAPKTKGSRSSTPMNINFPMGGSMASSSSGVSSAVAAATSSMAGPTSAAINNINKLQNDVDMQLAAANKALDVANAAIAKADAFFPISSGDLNYRDSFRSSPMNTYNVTVNGALNSEQTARQIITLLNDSQARGTQGATQLVTTSGAIGF